MDFETELCSSTLKGAIHDKHEVHFTGFVGYDSTSLKK